MEWEGAIADYLSACAWYMTLPSRLQRLVEQFPPGSQWRLRSQSIHHLAQIESRVIGECDCFVPVSFTGRGQIDVMQYDGLTGLPILQDPWRVRPVDLIPLAH